jgi:hypothetical protein
MLLIGLAPAYSDDQIGGDETVADDSVIIWQYPHGDKSLLRTTSSTPGDLLRNGDMDQEGLYWKYPNHYIVGGWFEWFSTRRWIPEFDNGNRMANNFVHTPPNSQRIHAWANSYAGGLIQSVTVTPCTYYQFQVYGHSRPGNEGSPPPVPVDSHMKVGIEPYGWMSERTPPPPPNYDPGLEPEEIPSTVIWSPEATHNFVFMPYAITAEARSTKVTVIMFSNPEIDPDNGVVWNDTIWDTASLLEVPPPSGIILDSAIVPEPDGLITNLTTDVVSQQATIEWDTTVDASTQLLYRVLEPSDPISVTHPLSYSLHFPVLSRSKNPYAMQHSPFDSAPVSHHKVVLTDLPDDYVLEFVALSRRLNSNACVTSASDFMFAEPGDGALANTAPEHSEGP